MPDRYAVVGNPVAHSKSPQIHAAFALATGQDLTYERLLAPIGGFAAVASAFAHEGGRGLNVTVPFKLDAFALADDVSEGARLAGAVNTLKREDGRWIAFNTDGPGIVRDLLVNRGVVLTGKRVLLLGAGGAARGVLKPLLDALPLRVTIANRTVDRAVDLANAFARHGDVEAMAPGGLAGRAFDVVVNATSYGLRGEGDALPWPATIFADRAFAYDMVYADDATPFLSFAARCGVAERADGLGMLVEQAAESFYLWRGVRPQTAQVFALLRPAAR